MLAAGDRAVPLVAYAKGLSFAVALGLLGLPTLSASPQDGTAGKSVAEVDETKSIRESTAGINERGNMSMLTRSFERDLRLKVQGEYHLRLPQDYESSPRRWPLLIYLHGMGGWDEILSSNGPHNLMKRDGMEDFILCMPKCTEARWPTDMVLGLIQQLMADYRIDAARIYLTGVSIGGLATWELALRRPFLFAAIVPLCGAGQPWNAYKIAHVPCWVFHGRKDQIVPVAETEAMVRALQEDGSAVKVTLFEASGHEIREEVYGNQALWQWMFAQKNPQPDKGIEVQLPPKS